MTFEELNNPVVTEETPAVEPETTEESTPEVEEPQTTTESPEEAPADVSDQPEEEVEETPRAQKRIQELTRKNKELGEKAAYWDQLNARLPEAPAEEEDGVVTVDSIAKAVKHELKSDQIENDRLEAQKAMHRSAVEALEAYPQLEDDEEAAEIVVALAEKKKISFKAAADRFYARTEQTAKKAEAKAVANKALKVGASTPTGNRVSNGELAAPNISAMSEEDKAANWDTILASMRS